MWILAWLGDGQALLGVTPISGKRNGVSWKTEETDGVGDMGRPRREVSWGDLASGLGVALGRMGARVGLLGDQTQHL